jgi:hypothetical protein
VSKTTKNLSHIIGSVPFAIDYTSIDTMNKSHEKISDILCRSSEGEVKRREIKDIYIQVEGTE